ncbi:hypothetical protein HK097_000476 [Rhizophlyctis rosea]|uniref:Bestrophin homolog n=1 Tax=Rhizophlyctis rosea TaxID=64517 RepID=A0AAD5WZG6_9FUNG|nr:hypothetical protein HK097_000476 [Rhizophlyctis rosea]
MSQFRFPLIPNARRRPTTPGGLPKFEEEDQELTWRLTGSVVGRTLPAAVFYTIYGAAIVCLYEFLDLPFLAIPMIITGILGMTLGLLLAFRSNLAYDRFWEGRKLWSVICVNIRNLSRFIWLIGPDETPLDYAQKAAIMKLLIALPIAEKHELRGEHDWHTYDDLSGLIPMIPTANDKAAAAHRAGYAHARAQSSSSQVTINVGETAPLLGGEASRDLGRRTTVTKKKVKKHVPGAGVASTCVMSNGIHRSDYSCGCVNLPEAVLDQIGAWIALKLKEEKINLMIGGTFIGLLNALGDATTNLDRILTTKIPLAYAIHLRQSLVVYCLTLPFQLIRELQWYTIPVMFIAVFTLFGIENIGFEIQNPFGYDPNDLPLDDYCETVRAELEAMLSEPYSEMANWDATYVLSKLGLPDRHRPKEEPKEEAGPSGTTNHVDLNTAAHAGAEAAKSDSVPGSVTEEEIGNTADSFKVQVNTGSNVAGAAIPSSSAGTTGPAGPGANA